MTISQNYRGYRGFLTISFSLYPTNHIKSIQIISGYKDLKQKHLSVMNIKGKKNTQLT